MCATGFPGTNGKRGGWHACSTVIRDNFALVRSLNILSVGTTQSILKAVIDLFIHLSDCHAIERCNLTLEIPITACSMDTQLVVVRDGEWRNQSEIFES